MYGLEKNKGEAFIFDLEKEIKSNPERGPQILNSVGNKIEQIKKHLREGASEQEFDQMGILLHGYTALQKVLRKVAK